MNLPLSENRFDLDNFLSLGTIEESISTDDKILFNYLVKRWIMLGAEYRLNDNKYDEYLVKYRHISSRRVIGEKTELCLQISESPIIRVIKYGEQKIDAEKYCIYRLKRENNFRDIIWYNDIPICIGTSERGKINKITVPQLLLIHQSNLYRIRHVNNNYFKLTFDHTQTKADIPMYIDNLELLNRPEAISNNSKIHIEMDLRKYYKSTILMNKDIDAYKLYLKKQGEKRLNQLKMDLLKEEQIDKNGLSNSEINRMRTTYDRSKKYKFMKHKKLLLEELKDKTREFYNDINTDSFKTHFKYPDCKFITDIEKKIKEYFDIFNILSKRGIECNLVLIISYDIKIKNNGKVYHKNSDNKFYHEVDRIALNLFNKLPAKIVGSNSLDSELIVVQNKL